MDNVNRITDKIGEFTIHEQKCFTIMNTHEYITGKYTIFDTGNTTDTASPGSDLDLVSFCNSKACSIIGMNLCKIIRFDIVELFDTTCSGAGIKMAGQTAGDKDKGIFVVGCFCWLFVITGQERGTAIRSRELKVGK